MFTSFPKQNHTSSGCVQLKNTGERDWWQIGAPLLFLLPKPIAAQCVILKFHLIDVQSYSKCQSQHHVKWPRHVLLHNWLKWRFMHTYTMMLLQTSTKWFCYLNLTHNVCESVRRRDRVQKGAFAQRWMSSGGIPSPDDLQRFTGSASLLIA